MSGIRSHGPGIARKPVPHPTSSAPHDDYRTVEQIPMEYWTRPTQENHASLPVHSMTQPTADSGYQREQSQATQPDLGFEFSNLNLKPPPFVSEHPKAHTSSTEAVLMNELRNTNSMHQEVGYNPVDTGWTPLYLRRITFVVFIVVFIAILIALAVLYSYSERNQGLSTANPNLHYLWTYGPTAVLTIIYAFWGQVEFRMTQLMPWKAMATRPQPANDSVLLDYISPWNVLALLQSLKKRHYVVSIAIIGTLLLKLMTVFSTGLFGLQLVSAANPNTPLIATDKFDGSSYNSKFVDARPMYAAIGVQLLNMSYPPGTTPEYAVQTFNVSTPSNSTLIGIVDAFSPDLECELGELTVQKVNTLACNPHACPQYNVTVATPSCHAAGILFLGPQYNAFGGPDHSEIAYSAALQPGICTNVPVRGDPNRMIVSVQQLRYHGDDENPDFDLEKSVNLVCKPTYAIRRALVSAYSDTTSNGSHWNVSTPSDAESNRLPQVSGWDVANGVFSSLQSVTPLGWQNQGRGSDLFVEVGLQNTTEAFRTDVWFSILAGNLPGDIADWFDVEALNATSRHLYISMAAQVAKRFLTVPTQEPFIGTSFTNENRLFMRALSFGLMEAFAVILIAITILLFFWAPRGVVIRDPGSIAGMATILKQSPEMIRSVQNLGHSGTSAIWNRIREHRYSTSTGMGGDQPHFAIRASAPRSFEKIVTPVGPNPDSRLRWWQPISLTLPARVLTLAIPIALIVILESLYQHSQRHNGLADVDPNGYAHYAWTYIPASVMLSAGALFRMVNFNTKVYQPYHALRRGAVPASNSILENHLGKIALYEFWSAAFKQQYAIAATTLAVLLAPLLTIAVSGLYISGSYGSPVTVQQLTYFNFSIAEGGGLELAAPTPPVINLLVEGNLSFPQWTFDDLVFPQIRIDAGSNPDNETLMSLNTQVPAVRGALSCHGNGRSLLSAKFSKSAGYNTLTFNLSTPDGCGNYFAGASETTDYASDSMELPAEGGYFGHLFEGDLGGGPDRWNKSPQCPSKLAVWGLASASQLEDITMAACYENIEQVSTNVTFQLPHYSISPSLPPQILENTAMNITHLPEVLNIGVSDFLTPLNHSGELFDGFFSVLVHGNNPMPVDYLANYSKLPEIITAIEKLYAIVAAQSINAAPLYRYPFNSSTNLSEVNAAERAVLTGTLFNPNPVRLRQNAVSTRILEALLAAIFLCAAISSVLMDTRRVLPKNPCSIAAVASLLAGSDMLDKGLIPDGAEWCDDEELKRRGVFEGYLFSMGWWGDKDGDGRRFGIDVGRAEAERGLPFMGVGGNSKRERETR